MTSCEPAIDQNHLADEYLGTLRVLAAEVEAGMFALAHNELPKFREHVTQQENLCSKLQELMITLCAHRKHELNLTSTSDSNIEKQIHAAHRKLAEVNRQYALLLERSNRSLSLLTALCRTYGDRFEQTTSRPTPYATWSCEV